MTDSMFELADELKALREEKAEAEEALKRINAQITETDERLSTLMMDSETQNFTRSGTMFSLRTQTRASATAGRKDELFAALRAGGFGDLITEQVNANSLSAFVKEQITENAGSPGGTDVLPGWLDGLVNVYEQTTVSLRKSTK